MERILNEDFEDKVRELESKILYVLKPPNKIRKM